MTDYKKMCENFTEALLHEQISRECCTKWFEISSTVEELQAENEQLKHAIEEIRNRTSISEQ